MNRVRLVPCFVLLLAPAVAVQAAWPLHVIDDSSRGADGVRLTDVNSDGLMDIATGWEEGGLTRVYLHPGHVRAKENWPSVVVGRTPSVEDAAFADLDGDGRMDVVTCCEGRERTVYAHWAPADPDRLLDPSAWRQEVLGRSAGGQMYMFALPMQVDGRGGIDLVVGGKGEDAEIGWYESPPEPRSLEQWRWHPISPAGWVMSLIEADMDGDGDMDVVTTDRRGDLRGCRWLEHPDQEKAIRSPWPNHSIGGCDWEMMFMKVIDLDGDGLQDAIAAAKQPGRQCVLLFQRLDPAGLKWGQHVVDYPENTGGAKAVAAGDINRDGRLDLVVSCEGARDKRGVLWMECAGSPWKSEWTAYDISGLYGVKYDRIELIDLDGDEDLDVLTCEEQVLDPKGRQTGIGVFWYENPGR